MDIQREALSLCCFFRGSVPEEVNHSVRDGNRACGKGGDRG